MININFYGKILTNDVFQFKGSEGCQNSLGILPDSDKMDASFFLFTPSQANSTDPGSRMLQEAAYEAIIDAGMFI